MDSHSPHSREILLNAKGAIARWELREDAFVPMFHVKHLRSLREVDMNVSSETLSTDEEMV